ncbi:MAG: hypothetical protein ACPH2K_06455, partial [Flavicella sp.]
LVSPLQSRLYYARIINTVTGCTSIIEIDIVVHEIPEVRVSNIDICAGETIELNTLTTSNSSNTVNFYDSYEKAINAQNRINSNSITPTESKRYFVRKTNKYTSCYQIQELNIRIQELPEIQSVLLSECDDDSDGKTFFNLTEKTDEIISNPQNYNFSYYETEQDAIIGSIDLRIETPSNYRNAVSTADVVWVRVEDSKGCFEVTPIYLKVTNSLINASFVTIFKSCDDRLDLHGNSNSDNNDSDGVSSFDFSDATEIIRKELPADQSFTIDYYLNQEDGLQEVNPIKNKSNFRNSKSPESQSIWVRINNKNNDNCYAFGPFVLLIVEAIPSTDKVDDMQICENDVNGFYLDDQTADMLRSKSNPNEYLVTYHKSPEDAVSGNYALSSPYKTENNAKQKIYTRVMSKKTGCVNPHGSFNLITTKIPTLNQIDNVEACDTGAADGIFDGFDLALKRQQIIGQLNNSNFNINFYHSKYDAQKAENRITDNFYENKTPYIETIYLRIENTLTGCVNTNYNFDLIVQKSPYFEIENVQYVCTDNSFGLEMSTKLNPNLYHFEWTAQNGEILSNDAQFTTTYGGFFTVTSFNKNPPFCSYSQTVEVIESNAASISHIQIDDGEAINSIEVSVIGNGDYEYQLDSGEFTDSPIFDEVTPGIHSITVNDKRGCGSVFKDEIIVLEVPKYLSPEQGGKNAVWKIDLGQLQGVQFERSVITILDRTGNILKVLNPLSSDSELNSWNGKINGKTMVQTDY